MEIGPVCSKVRNEVIYRQRDRERELPLDAFKHVP